MAVGFVNMPESDKDTLCESVYSSYIFGTYDFLVSCENYSEVIRAKLPEGCYTNFRDALFHFRKMYRSSEQGEIRNQAFAIREHAGRAKTDAIISLLQDSALVLGELLTSFEIQDDLKAELIAKHDWLRSMEKYVRLSGMMLEDLVTFRVSDDAILDYFNDILFFCKENLCEQFRQTIESRA